MIELARHPEGAILPVRAQPGARRNEIRGEHIGMLRVCVTQIAEKGKANKALLAVLSRGLGLKKSQIELIGGQTSADKRFLIREVTLEELAEKVDKAVSS